MVIKGDKKNLFNLKKNSELEKFIFKSLTIDYRDCITGNKSSRFGTQSTFTQR